MTDVLERAGEAASDPFVLGQRCLGLWFRPVLGAKPELRGRVVVFDLSASESRIRADVTRMIARFCLRQRGVAEIDEAIDYIAQRLFERGDVERSARERCFERERRSSDIFPVIIG